MCNGCIGRLKVVWRYYYISWANYLDNYMRGIIQYTCDGIVSIDYYAEMSEWSIVQSWNGCVQKCTQGSNPCLCAKNRTPTVFFFCCEVVQ